MGSIGVKSAGSSEPEKFTYTRSPELKEWSAAEEKRAADMTKYIFDKLNTGDFGEFYEENPVDELVSVRLAGEGVYRDDEISITKMNLVYAQNWDENERRVKQGKAVTGSTYYVVQTDNGSIDESRFAYKTKADAEHAMNLYIDEYKQRIAYWKRREKK